MIKRLTKDQRWSFLIYKSRKEFTYHNTCKRTLCNGEVWPQENKLFKSKSVSTVFMLCVLTVQDLKSQSPLPPSSARVWPQAKIQIKLLITQELLGKSPLTSGPDWGSLRCLTTQSSWCSTFTLAWAGKPGRLLWSGEEHIGVSLLNVGTLRSACGPAF